MTASSRDLLTFFIRFGVVALLATIIWVAFFHGPQDGSGPLAKSLLEERGENPAGRVETEALPTDQGEGTALRTEDLLLITDKPEPTQLHVRILAHGAGLQTGHIFSIHPLIESISKQKHKQYQDWADGLENDGVFITDGKGEALVTVPAEIELRVESSMENQGGFYGWKGVRALRQGETYSVTVVLHAMEGDSFYGRLAEAIGNKPVASAQIFASNHITHSDENGLFRLWDIEPGEKLEIVARGYAPQTVLAQSNCLAANLAQLISMSPEGGIGGLVMFGDKPAVGATIYFERIRGEGEWGEHNFQWTDGRKIDSKGRFHVRRLSSGETYRAHLEIPESLGFYEGPMEVIMELFPCREELHVKPGKSLRYDIQLKDWVKIVGTVRLSDGSILSEANVLAAIPEDSKASQAIGQIVHKGDFFPHTHSQGFINQEGDYSIPFLPPGIWEIGVSYGFSDDQPWYSQAVVVHVPAGAGEIKVDHILELKKLMNISGRVISNFGEPVVGIRMCAIGEDSSYGVSDLTNEFGEFEIKDLLEMDYSLSLSEDRLENGEWAPPPVLVGQETSGLEIRTLPSTGFRYSIVDANGQGTPARMRFRRRRSGYYYGGGTKDNGVGEVNQFLPGVYDIKIDTEESGIYRIHGVTLKAEQMVDLGRLTLQPVTEVTFTIATSIGNDPKESFEVWAKVDGVMGAIAKIWASTPKVVPMPYGSYSFELRQGDQVLSTVSQTSAQVTASVHFAPSHSASI